MTRLQHSSQNYTTQQLPSSYLFLEDMVVLRRTRLGDIKMIEVVNMLGACQSRQEHSVQPPSQAAATHPPSCTCTHSRHYTAPAGPAVSAANFCRSPPVAVDELGPFAAAPAGWLSTIRSSGCRLGGSSVLCLSTHLLVLLLLSVSRELLYLLHQLF